MKLEAIDAGYAALRSDLAHYVQSGGRLAVVKAPPGSGKTHTLIEVISSLVTGGMRIAVAAQTNSQADDICRRWANEHPEVPVARFSSTGLIAAVDFPTGVLWVTDRKELPTGPGITVATTAKWSLTDIAAPYDLLAIDESWQMSWADLMQCALVSGKFLMIGDPGQIPPVVAIDVRRWETSPRAPHEAAPEVVLAERTLDSERFVGSLPACRRLPSESVDFVKPFYDFDFEAYIGAGTRGLELFNGWGDSLPCGRPLALTIPTPDHGPPIEVDHHIALAAAKVVGDLLTGGAILRVGEKMRALAPSHIGITSSHRVMNSALAAAIGPLVNEIRIDTPERWQGLERPVMIAVHPLSGVSQPSAFDLETGRLCVMASRHQVAFILLTRDHVGETLRNYVPSADQAPGRPDVVGRGHDAHLKFWSQLESRDCVVPLT
jgi:AAA domain